MAIKRTTQQGFALFMTVVITGTLLLVATGIVTLAVRQALISASGRESQLAFYAADTGMECALYWDVGNPAGSSAFGTSTGSTISCNQDASNSGNSWVVGGNTVSVIDTITFLPDPYCAKVTVTKNSGQTIIESRGYNTCNVANLRRVERAVRATYGSVDVAPPETFSFTASASSAERGTSVTISWTGLSNEPGSPSANNWVGFFPPGANDFGFTGSFYLGSCSSTKGGVPANSGSCSFTVPANATAQAGYKFSLFEDIPPANGLSSISNFTVTSAVSALPSFRSSAQASSASGVLTLAINKPTGTVQNDVMIASVAFRPSTVVVTPPSGWTLVRRVNNSNPNENSLATYYKAAGGSEASSYSWSFNTSTGAAGGILSFSGVNTSSPVDDESGQNTPATDANSSTPSARATVADTIVVTAHAVSSAVTWTPPTGMTEAVDISNVTPPADAGEALEMNYVSRSNPGSTGVKTATQSIVAGFPVPDAGNAQILILHGL